MKSTYSKLILISLSILIFSVVAPSAPSLNIDVADQNFNTTDKIVIEQEEIQRSRANNLPTLLATKANISISTTNLQPNSIYIRGGDSSHVLILVDGVPTYDASTTQRTLNLFGVNLSKIKRIEVLKGSQSVLYGGQALSGVIKIETFANDSKNGTTVTADAAAGKYNSTKRTLSVDTLQNISEQIDLTASVYGLDALNASPSLGSDKLYPQQTGAADLAVRLKGDIENIFKLNYSKDFNSITNSNVADYKPLDADDFHANTELLGGTWILRKSELFNLSVTHQKADRTFDQEASKTVLGTVTDEDYEGILTNVRLDSYLLKTDVVNLMAGLQYSDEAMTSSRNGLPTADFKAQYEGVYLKSDFILPQNFLLEYGVRQENSKGRALASSYHVGVIWNQFLKVEYSTGFKTPSLFQLYSSYGNPDLKPESSKDFSIGLEHKLSDQVFTSLTFFDTQFENLIEFVPAPTSRYSNVAKTRAVGVESQTSANFYDGSLRLSLSLGYQEPKNSTTGRWLGRRPLRTASIKASSDLTRDYNLGVELVHTGEKLDSAGGTLVTVEDYTLVHVFSNYRISDVISVFARIDNLGNKNYQASYSYYNQGSIYKLGAQLDF